MNKILDGIVYTHDLGKWIVFWESDGNYRHWCYQKQPSNKRNILLVMFNPGSLRGDGNDFTKDITLRILREVFEDTDFNPFIINLFDFATASPNKLFEKWESRDNKSIIYNRPININFSAILYAYGDFENLNEHGSIIQRRIRYVRKKYYYLPEIILPKNKSGTPKHPILWQRQKIKPEIKSIVKKYSELLP